MGVTPETTVTIGKIGRVNGIPDSMWDWYEGWGNQGDVQPFHLHTLEKDDRQKHRFEGPQPPDDVKRAVVYCCLEAMRDPKMIGVTTRISVDRSEYRIKINSITK